MTLRIDRISHQIAMPLIVPSDLSIDLRHSRSDLRKAGHFEHSFALTSFSVPQAGHFRVSAMATP